MRSPTVSQIVYIVDDDPSVRQSLVLWLGMRGHRTQEFGSAEEFLAEIRPDSRGCAIVDVRLTGIDGIELQNRLREREIRLPLLFVTGHGDVSTARSALKGGAFDFIEKPIDSDHLVEVVAAALADDRQRAQESAQVAQLRERIARLTRREREVMEQVVAGRHNREIAAQLGISPRTVEVYKARLMDKLDVQRVADLVKLAVRNHEAVAEPHDSGPGAAATD